MDNWSEEFASLLNSPLGKELVRTLKVDLHDTLLEKAQDEKISQEQAYGLLMQTAGVKKVLEHLQFRSK